MRVAPFLLVCFLILSATGWLDCSLRRMRIDRGLAVALTLLLLALSALPFDISAHISVQPACILLLLLACIRAASTEDWLLAFSTSFIAGIADWLLYRMVPYCFEWGLLLAIPQTLLCALVPRRERPSMLCLLIAPFVFSLVLSLEELLIFGDAKLMLGSSLLLDIQVCALALRIILHSATYVAKRLGRYAEKQFVVAAKKHT